MSEPKIVTPHEADAIGEALSLNRPVSPTEVYSLAHTVATEPDRTRAAVVTALLSAVARVRIADAMTTKVDGPNEAWSAAAEAISAALEKRAEAIRNGAPFDV